MKVRLLFLSALVVYLLAGCGGGGGGGGGDGGSSNTSSTNANSALIFSPSVATGTYDYGNSIAIPIKASVRNPNDFKNASAVYVQVIDTSGVIGGAVNIWNNGDGTYTATINTSSTIAPGEYKGNFSVKICKDNNCSSQFPGSPSLLPYDIHVKPLIQVSPTPLILGGDTGRDFSDGSLTINIQPANSSWTWKVTDLPAWASMASAQGTGNQSGATLTFTPDQNAQVGIYSATSTASITINGETTTVPLDMVLNVDEHKILASEDGVGFASTPTWSRLSRTITVTDNFGKPTAWHASSNQSWLSVTGGGTNNSSGKSSITLTADATSLQADTVNYATITITADDPAITHTDKIKVALWKGSTTPSANTEIPYTYTTAQDYFRVAADPIRPYVYLNHNGSIDVYNIYTGQKVTTISPLSGEVLQDMTISTNGDKLYIVDYSGSVRKMDVIDLNTYSRVGSWNVMTAVDPLYIRPNGVGVIVSSDSQAYSASDGKVVSTSYLELNGYKIATPDGKMVYSQSSQLTNISSYRTDYFGGSEGKFIAKHLADGDPFATRDVSSFAVTRDGTRLYTASSYPTHCQQLDPISLSIVSDLADGDPYGVTGVAVGSDGRIYCKGGVLYTSDDLWVHDSSGNLLSTMQFTHDYYLAGGLVISSDGLMLADVMTDPGTSVRLVLIPMGP